MVLLVLTIGVISYLTLYFFMVIATVLSVGVLVFSLNTGLKNLNIIKQTTDSKKIHQSYKLLIIGGFLISLTLTIISLYLVINTNVNQVLISTFVILLVTYIYHAIILSHRYHLSEFTENLNSIETGDTQQCL